MDRWDFSWDLTQGLLKKIDGSDSSSKPDDTAADRGKP